MQEFLSSHGNCFYGIKISEQIGLVEKEPSAGMIKSMIKSIWFYQIERWA